MQYPFQPKTPSFDMASINDTIQRALSSAGLDTSSGPMHGVTETIRRALASGGLPAAGGNAASNDSVIDVTARVVEGNDADAPAITQPPSTAKV